jgi:hypothetical protein
MSSGDGAADVAEISGDAEGVHGRGAFEAADVAGDEDARVFGKMQLGCNRRARVGTLMLVAKNAANCAVLRPRTSQHRAIASTHWDVGGRTAFGISRPGPRCGLSPLP